MKSPIPQISPVRDKVAHCVTLFDRGITLLVAAPPTLSGIGPGHRCGSGSVFCDSSTSIIRSLDNKANHSYRGLVEL